MYQLTEQNVSKLYNHCLYFDGEQGPEIMVQGVYLNAIFSKHRIVDEEPLIKDLLHQLPEPFFRLADGYSAMHAYETENNGAWTENVSSVDKLICLGIAVDAIHFSLSRKYWSYFPDCVPHIKIVI
jgi:hypothetical protein